MLVCWIKRRSIHARPALFRWPTRRPFAWYTTPPQFGSGVAFENENSIWSAITWDWEVPCADFLCTGGFERSIPVAARTARVVPVQTYLAEAFPKEQERSASKLQRGKLCRSMCRLSVASSTPSRSSHQGPPHPRFGSSFRSKTPAATPEKRGCSKRKSASKAARRKSSAALY